MLLHINEKFTMEITFVEKSDSKPALTVNF